MLPTPLYSGLFGFRAQSSCSRRQGSPKGRSPPPAAGAHEAVVHPEEARENWEWALSLAARTGGRVIQIVVRPGLSKAQEGEARLAAAKGVAVVQLDCQAVAYFAGGCAHPLDSLSGWTELERLTRRKRGTGKAPLPRPLHRHATLGVCGEVYLYLAVP